MPAGGVTMAPGSTVARLPTVGGAMYSSSVAPVGVNQFYPRLHFIADGVGQVGVDDGRLVHEAVPVVGDGGAVTQLGVDRGLRPGPGLFQGPLGSWKAQSDSKRVR